MGRSKRRRLESTILRDNQIHDAYKDIMNEIGHVKEYVSKSYIYEEISKKVKLSTRTVSYVLNHTKKEDLS